MADINAVETHLIRKDMLIIRRHEIIARKHLFFIAVDNTGGTGNPRAHRHNLILSVFRPFHRDLIVFGAGTDEAHIAHQHIPQLRQFIDFCIAQPASQRSDAFIIGRSDERSAMALGRFNHGAEFPDDEFLFVFPCPSPSIKNRTRRLTLNQNIDD